MLMMLIYWAEAYILQSKKAEVLLVGIKEVSLEVNADKTKYMVMSRVHDARRSHSMKIDNSSFEMAGEFKYLGTTLKK